MSQFDTLGLAEPILRAIRDEGYTTPTPIQSQVIPLMMSGRDVLGIAQTGTGKTAAFVLPLLNAIAAERGAPKPKTCRALILAPTRELAAQIAENIAAYGRHTRHSAAVIVGGAKLPGQIRTLARGVDIVVATPGRLLDHLGSGNLRLDTTTTVVLDEADQMFDLGFMPSIRKILAKLPKSRQTMLLSATMPKPIRVLANEFLRDPAEVTVTPNSKPIDRIDQRIMHVESGAKRAVLLEILRTPDLDRAIVFTRTKRGADKVTKTLQGAGVAASAIHGNKSQAQRVKCLAAFRTGEVNVLVATDIAARGIDVDGVSHVVNFELPNVPEAYVHRIGRTARAGKSGFAVTLCDRSERSLLRDIEKLIGRRFDATPPPEVSADAISAANAPPPRAETAPAQPRGNHGRNGNGRGKPRHGDKPRSANSQRPGKPRQRRSRRPDGARAEVRA